MEPKQNYLMVGMVVVLIVTGLLGFTVWLAGLGKDADYNPYQTFVRESVNGLAVGSAVKYRGVDVGKVTDIRISRKDPARIQILMMVEENTPITVGTVAVLQMQGITGVSYVDLRGAVAGAEPIRPKDGGKVPIIPSAPSEFRQIVDTVPDMLQKFTELAQKLGMFASDENQKRLASILTNLDTFSQQVGGPNADGQTMVQEMQRTLTEIRHTAEAINGTVSSSRADTQRILKSTVVALDKITKLTEATTTLSQEGYKDLRELQVEIKKTARELQALSRDLKENPSKVIIPVQAGGIKAD